jgi:hypothetical protein
MSDVEVEQRASVDGAPAPRDPEETFLDLLANRGKQDPDAGPARTHGFVVLATGTDSLQPLQQLCFDTGRTGGNTCLTARYRLGPGPIFGTLFWMFARDLRALGEARQDPLVLGRLKGDLLPMGPDPLATRWSKLLQHSRLMAAAEDLAGDDATAHRIEQNKLDGFLGVLGDESVLPRGYRLVLFCELPAEQVGRSPPVGAPGPNPGSRLTRDWAAASTAILDRLPERVGLAFAVPDPVTPTMLRTDRVHQRRIDLSDQELGPADVARRFKPAALAGDRPAWRDHLGRARFAASIAQLILHSQTEPLTMGIGAPWGKGKSSFLNLISREFTRTACDRIDPALGHPLKDAEDQLAEIERERLDLAAEDQAKQEDVEGRRRKRLEQQERLWRRREHRARSEVVQVRFNAWRYQDATHIWAGLVSEVSKEVEASLPRRSRILAPLLHALRQRTTEFLVGVVFPTVLAALVGVVLYLLGGRADGGDAANQVPALLRWLLPGLGVLAVIVWRVFKVVQPISARMIDYVRLPDYREQLGFQTQVLHDLTFLRRCLKRLRLRWIRGRPRLVHEDPKIVVFIDDLDRCPDRIVMEVLQTINLILGESGLFVLLAVDTEKIHRAIANAYRSEGAASADPSFAESYLRKIVQLSFYLPESDPEQRLALVDEQFSPAARRRPGPSRAAGADGATRGAGPEGVPDILGVDADAVISPRVVTTREVEDTPEELETFRALKDFTPDNPRELKRLLNTHRFIKILQQRPETPPSEELQRKLVAWLVFCTAWPQLVDNVLDLAAGVARADPRRDCLRALVRRGDLDPAKPVLEAFQRAAERAQVVLRAADLEPGSLLARAATSSELIRVDANPARPAQLPPVTPSG